MNRHTASPTTNYHTTKRAPQHTTDLSRRRLVSGVAWSTPVILASATVPAWAASTISFSPVLTVEPTVTGYDDAGGAYREWIVPEGTSRVRFDLVGGAGGLASSLTPIFITAETNAALAGGGAGARISGTVAVTAGDVLRIWAGNGGVGSASGARPAVGGGGYGAGGSSSANSDSASSGVATRTAQNPPDVASTTVYGSSGGGSSAIELIHEGTVSLLAVAGGGGGSAQFSTLITHHAVFEAQPKDQLNPALRIARKGTASSTTAGGNAGTDILKEDGGTGSMLVVQPYQNFNALNLWTSPLNLNLTVTGGSQGRAGVPGSLGKATLAVFGKDQGYQVMDMSTPWFEDYDFPPYYAYGGDSVVSGQKGSGGVAATSGYKGAGGHGALLSGEHGRFHLTSVASGGGAGYGGGGAGLNLWTVATYSESVFGRQVQFEDEGNIYSLSAFSSGGGAGGSYVNHELVTDFTLATASNANKAVGVRSPGSAVLYTGSENATLDSPADGKAG